MLVTHKRQIIGATLLAAILALAAIAMPLQLARAHDSQAKYALVIGGASKQAEPEYQEFARNTAAVTEGLAAEGYQVVTLFGGPPIRGSDALAERSKYVVDYSKLRSLQIGQKSQRLVSDPDVTSAGIDAALDRLIAKAKSGDKIEIYVTAHGEDSCGALGTLIRNDLGSGCEHSFTVFDAQGREVQYPSGKIIAALSKLEAKGALPTLVLDSCHSGRAIGDFKKRNLANTCVYFETAGNETGYGCFENDPPFARDSTSTGEYISMRYYQSILKRLEKDPYYSKEHGTCFWKTVAYAQTKKMNLGTIESAYWSSRRYDTTFESPSISPLIGLDYFTTGDFSPNLPESKALSCTQVNLGLDSVLRQLPEVRAVDQYVGLSSYQQAIGEYNTAVAQLEAALGALKTMPDPPREMLGQVANLQKSVKEKALSVITNERSLIQGYYQQAKQSDQIKSSSCERNL